MDERRRIMRDAVIADMTAMTRQALDAHPPKPYGWIRWTYAAVVALWIVIINVVDLLLDRPVEALVHTAVAGSMIGVVTVSWIVSNARSERATLSALWNAYAMMMLSRTDDSIMNVNSLRILAVAERTLTPRAAELTEVASQMEHADADRAGALAAYLQLRAAAHDRAMLDEVSKTMRGRA